MKVNGYQIREALKRLDLQRSTLASQVNEAVYVFADEKKQSPQSLVEAFSECDARFAKLQEIQQTYNQLVKVTIGDQEFSLSLAVKRIGGAGRVEKMYRGMVVEKKDRYSYNESVKSRSKDSIYATKTIKTEDALKLADKAASFASNLRAAIAKGNAVDIDVNGNFQVTEEELAKLLL